MQISFIVRERLSFHQRQNLRLLRLGIVRGEMGDDPIATWMRRIQLYLENNDFKEMNRIE